MPRPNAHSGAQRKGADPETVDPEEELGTQTRRARSGSDWWWLTETGSESAGSEEELISALSSEKIPSFTLVWRAGWAEWLPVSQVSELSWALPAGKAGTPRRAASGNPELRPEPDWNLFSRLRAQTHTPESDAEAIEPELGSGLRSDEIASLSDADLDDDPDDASSIAVRELQASPARGSSALAIAHAPPDSSSRPTRELLAPVHRGPSAPTHPDPWRQPSPKGSFDSGAQMGPSVPLLSQVDPFSAERLDRRTGAADHLRWIGWAAAGIACVGMLAWWTANDGGDGARTPEARATEPDSKTAALRSAPTPPVPAPPTCRIGRSPTQLGEWAHPQVRPLAATTANGWVAIGYAQSIFYALGITVDPVTLDQQTPFRAFRRQSIVNIAPLVHGNLLEFLVERAPSDLAFAISVTPELSIGQVNGAIATRRRGEAPKPIWDLPLGLTISVPGVARLPGDEWLVSFRYGGEQGTIYAGIFGGDGKKRSELVEMDRVARTVSEPSAASSSVDRVIAFSGLAEGNSLAPQIYLARGPGPGLPGRASAASFAVGATSQPQVAALDSHNFSLAWIETVDGKNHVKFAVLNPKLELSADPIAISAPDQHAIAVGQWVVGERVLAWYLVQAKANTELWGTSLACE